MTLSGIEIVNDVTLVSSVPRVLSVRQVVLHDTAGSTNNPDRNTADLASMLTREVGTVNYLTGGNAAGTSIHYIVGPEATGAKIHFCVPENRVAYHAIGNKGIYSGPYGSHSMDNEISIGIEVWGMPGEPKGPNQRRSVVALVVDIAHRYGLKPEQIVSHKSIQSDRSDGEAFLGACREAIRMGVSIPPAKTDNRNGKDVGNGVLEVLEKLGHKALTNEQYANWDNGEKFSLTWASDEHDHIYLYFAAPKPDGTWPVQVFSKEI